jgi:hypothetical protein
MNQGKLGGLGIILYEKTGGWAAVLGQVAII